MAVKELITKFGFEIDDKGLKELQEGIDSIKEGLIGLGEALLGEAVGLFEVVNHAAEAGVALKIMGQETGIAAEKLQELQFRAKLADVSTEELNQSMFFLARNMAQARNGSEEARKHFRQLGISTAELRSGTLSTDQVLERIGKTFQKLPDGARKAGLAAEIFGRSGARMIPFLNSLGNAISPINQKILEMSMITEEQIEESEAFHINLETLKTALLGITRVVGFGLLPVSNEIVEAMKKWVVENRQLIIQNLTEFVKGMAAALKVTIKIVDVLIKSFSAFAKTIGGVRIATELLLGAFAVLSGASVLFGIGKVVEAVVALGNAFVVTQLKAAAIPIAIGAAMVGLFLIMEDIFSFFQGKNSFTGDLLQKIPEIGKAFKSVFEPIFEPFVNLVTMLTDGFGSWKDIFKELGVIVVNTLLLPFRAVGNIVGLIIDGIGRVSGSKGTRDFAKEVFSAADDFRIGGNSGPQAAVSSAANSTNSKQTNNNLQVKQEFIFPPGTDPATVGPKISSSVNDGLGDLLRATDRSTSTGGQY